MIRQSPRRFLLADDAGAGKTIMTGLHLREALARKLIQRILVVPPAGLVGNWEREMRTLFRLPFRIVSGADARDDNPFAGPESDRIIVSLDTPRGDRPFERPRDAAPYDLVVFDEAHELAARRDRNRIEKTGRYQLAEALAGAPVKDARWRLGWSATNLLLLTATPHMGKDFPYLSSASGRSRKKRRPGSPGRPSPRVEVHEGATGRVSDRHDGPRPEGLEERALRVAGARAVLAGAGGHGLPFGLTVGHNPTVFSASAGLEFQFDSFVVRPRLDAVHVRSRSTRFERHGPAVAARFRAAVRDLEDEIRPWIFMIGLDVGFRAP